MFYLRGDSEKHMGVVITPLSPERLRVVGDIQTELPVPFDNEDRFHSAFSDGTLVANESASWLAAV